MRKLLFKNGQIAASDSSKLIKKDILVTDGKITGIENSIQADKNTTVIDCGNSVILPGLFDMHTHLREPGREDEETIHSGCEAAINGGFTGLVCMPNTDPAIDTGSVVTFIKALSREAARIPVHIAGCITQKREGQHLAEIGDMADKGIVMITDDGSPVTNSLILRRAMEYSRNFNLLIACHPETRELSEEGVINEGEVSLNLGLPGIPAAGEEIDCERILRIAELARARVHIQHLSTAAALESVRRFKKMKLPVTAEVTPHHLIFSERDITGYDTNFKINPPLRRGEDCDALLKGLKDGAIDCIATDHAPHTVFEKNQDFISAPFGIIGLETALLSIYTYLVKSGKLTWNILVRTMCENPRRILNLPVPGIRKGAPAEFIVFNLKKRTVISREFLRSKSCNTPLLGKTLNGSVDVVLMNGEILLQR